MSDTEDDPNVVRVRAGRYSYRSQAKRDRHADAQAKHRAKLRKIAAPGRSEIATVALSVLLLVSKKYPRDENVLIIRSMIENELAAVGFSRDQISARLDQMIARCDRDLAKWREYREFLERWRQRQNA
jgi:hypothetical protein